MTRPAQNFVSALLTAACIGLFAPAATAQYTFTNYTYGDGLGSNNVYGVYAQGDTIYAATSAGVTVSIDNGATWTNYTLNGLGNSFVKSIYAIDCTIYAGTTGGLSVSTAILADWANIYWTNYTHADGLGGSTVNGVYAVGDTIYAATGSINQSSGLSVSTDNGANWTNHNMPGSYVSGVYAQGDTIYAANYGGGVSVSTNNGANWTNYTTANGLGNNEVFGVYAQGDTIYAATYGGLSVSTDNGANWTNYTTANGLGGNIVNGVYAIGSTIYAATSGGGLSVSTDSGANWTNYTYADGLASNQMNGVYVQGDTIYAATNGGLSIGVPTIPPPPPPPATGLHFTNYSNQSSQVSLGIFEWVPYSFGSAGIVDVAVDSEGSIYLAQFPCTQCSPDPMVGGLSISDDGGCTWTTYTTDDGLPTNNLGCVSLDDSGNIYVGSSGGVSISEDGGLTWTTYSAANGLVDAPVVDIAVDNGTIYATCFESVNQVAGLSISDDGGKSWSIIDGSNGLPNDFTIAVVAQDGLVYVTNAQLQTGNFKNWSSAGGLSISSDGGQSWVTYNSSNGLAGNSAGAVTVDDGVIYVSTQSSGFPSQGGGVSSSSDGGTTWTILTQDWSSSDAAYDIAVAGGWLYVSADIDGTYGFYSYPLFVPQCTPTSWTMLTTADGLIFDDVGGNLYANGDSLYATQGVEVYDNTTGITTLTGGFMVLDSVPQEALTIDNLSSVDVAHGVICVGSTDAGVSVSSGPITSADSISWISASTSNGLGSNYVTSVQVGEDFLVAGTTGGVSVSTDGGFCWTNSTTADGLADDEVLAVYVHNGDIYAATPGGLSISTDQGASWTSPKSTLNLPLSDVYVETVLYQGQLVDAVYLAVGGGTPVVSFDGLATTIELNNQCGDYPYGTPSPYYLVVQGGKIYGFDGQFLGDAVVSEACDPSCDYECGWSKVPPWCGYVTDIELVGPDRWFATPTAGGLAGGLVFNPTGVTYSSCGTATRTFTTADGLGSNNCIAVSVGDGLVCVATDSGVSVASLGQCPGDFDLDGIIGGGELAQVLAYFGTPCDGSTPEACVLDLDGSGIVDAGDIAVLLEAWGSCE